MITRKQVMPYLVAFIVALVGALVAMGGVAITKLERTQPDLAEILIAGFVVMAAFAKLLPSPAEIIHPPVTVVNNTDLPITVQHGSDNSTLTINPAPPLPEGPVRAALPRGTQGHVYGDEEETVEPHSTVVVGGSRK